MVVHRDLMGVMGVGRVGRLDGYLLLDRQKVGRWEGSRGVKEVEVVVMVK